MFTNFSDDLNNNIILNDNSNNITNLEFDFAMCHSCYLYLC